MFCNQNLIFQLSFWSLPVPFTHYITSEKDLIHRVGQAEQTPEPRRRTWPELKKRILECHGRLQQNWDLMLIVMGQLYHACYTSCSSGSPWLINMRLPCPAILKSYRQYWSTYLGNVYNKCFSWFCCLQQDFEKCYTGISYMIFEYLYFRCTWQ
jgi:hypothetical protein